jgi:N-acetylmuramoyl-L-alanine amidase
MFCSLVTRGFAFLLLFGLPAARALDEEPPNDSAANLSVLGRKPDWSELEKYQATITHDEFVHLLAQVYGSHGYSPELFKIESEAARILMSADAPDYFVLHFAKSAADRKPVPRWWTASSALPAHAGAGPLTGLHIAIDPGHLGGTWAQMEERWFKIHDAPPVQEGDMTLRVARLLAPRLESLGAKVSLCARRPSR